MTEKKVLKELTVRLKKEDATRFHACLCSLEMHTGKRPTQQDVILELLSDWMDMVEQQHGKLSAQPVFTEKKRRMASL